MREIEREIGAISVIIWENYFFRSVRKWCGCWTDGYAYGNFKYGVQMSDCNSSFTKFQIWSIYAKLLRGG